MDAAVDASRVHQIAAVFYVWRDGQQAHQRVIRKMPLNKARAFAKRASKAYKVQLDVMFAYAPERIDLFDDTEVNPGVEYFGLPYTESYMPDGSFKTSVGLE